MANKETDKGRQVVPDSSDRVSFDSYDPHIIPAETAARKEREGNLFKTHPTEEREASAATDDQTDSGSIHTTEGYTVDKEGLINNYAIEPEMYYEVPGDAKEQAEDADRQRAAEYHDINQDESGKLTMENDQRGRGTGII